MPDPTTVGVVLATRNGTRFLPEQLASIVGQTRLPDELIVVDDASSDGTRALLEAFARRAPFSVRMLDADVCRGATETFAVGLEASRADVTLLCDQDDRWLPEKVDRLATAAASGADLSFCDAWLVDAQGTRLPGTTAEAFGLRGPEHARDAGFAVRAIVAPAVLGCTLALSARARDWVLPFPEAVLREATALRHDGWIMAVASAVGRVERLKDPLMSYRLHPDQAIGLPGRSPARDQLARYAGRRRERLGAARAVAERVAVLPGDAVTAEVLAELQKLQHHLALRDALPRRRERRLRPVLAELARGGYGRWSSGTRSALLDLLAQG